MATEVTLERYAELTGMEPSVVRDYYNGRSPVMWDSRAPDFASSDVISTILKVFHRDTSGLDALPCTGIAGLDAKLFAHSFAPQHVISPKSPRKESP